MAWSFKEACSEFTLSISDQPGPVQGNSGVRERVTPQDLWKEQRSTGFVSGWEGEEGAGVCHLPYQSVAPYPRCLPIRDLSSSLSFTTVLTPKGKMAWEGTREDEPGQQEGAVGSRQGREKSQGQLDLCRLISVSPPCFQCSSLLLFCSLPLTTSHSKSTVQLHLQIPCVLLISHVSPAL